MKTRSITFREVLGRVGLGLALAASASGATSPDGAVTIRLKDEVTVTDSTYRLGDIAWLGGPAAAVERLAAADIGRAPRPGNVAQVTQRQLVARVVRLEPGLSANARWFGERVLVRAAATDYPLAAIMDVARVTLDGWAGARYARFSAEPLAMQSRPIAVPAGRVSLKGRMSPAARLGKRMVVWVDIRVDGELFQAIPQWFEVTVPARVLVTTIEQAAGATVAPAATNLEERDIALLNAPPVVDTTVLGDMRTTRQLPAGSALTTADFEARPPVTRGQLVAVEATVGTVRLVARAEALSDGELAQRIRVQNPTSRETYTAVVIGEGVSRVD